MLINGCEIAFSALLAVVYLGPLALLLTIRAKRSRGYLGTVALLVLCGLWVERWWLVTPTLGQKLHLGEADIFMCAAFIGALIVGIGLFKQIEPEALIKANQRE